MSLSDWNMSFLTPERRNKLFLALLMTQILACIPYGFLPSGPNSFLPFFLLYSIQFLFFGACVWMLRATSVNWRWILGLAVLARIILLFTEPVLEDDFWRYLWDGRVLAHGFNPYAFKPLDPTLDTLDVAYRHHIGWKQFGTIYPPFSIYIFAFSHLLTGCASIDRKEETVHEILTKENVLLQKVKLERAQPEVSQAVLQSESLKKAEAHLALAIDEIIKANEVVTMKLMKQDEKEVEIERSARSDR